MATTAKISTGTTLVYEKGRGGALWPSSRHTALVNGETLLRKDGHPRRFTTQAAAVKAARQFVEEQQK